jgi:hypothetical protein
VTAIPDNLERAARIQAVRFFQFKEKHSEAIMTDIILQRLDSPEVWEKAPTYVQENGRYSTNRIVIGSDKRLDIIVQKVSLKELRAGLKKAGVLL